MGKKAGRRVFRRRVRKRSKPQRFVRIHELHCFADVQERLKAGWPIARIADFIQKERDEYNDVTRESLMKTLAAYRDSLKNTELLQARMPDKVVELQEEAEEALDEVKELAGLYKLQKERIAIDVESEKNIKKLFKTTGQEVFYAMKLLQTSAAIKMDYGLVKGRELPGTNVNVLALDMSRFGNQAVQDVVQDPVARRKVLSFVERLSKVQNKKKKLLEEQGVDRDLAETTVIEATLGE